jgi:glycine hydroxymethyltransferase
VLIRPIARLASQRGIDHGEARRVPTPIAWATNLLEKQRVEEPEHAVFRNELSINDQEIAAALVGEERRQQDGVELIPSENYTYPEVLELLGSVFTNKYSEGYPGR